MCGGERVEESITSVVGASNASLPYHYKQSRYESRSKTTD